MDKTAKHFGTLLAIVSTTFFAAGCGGDNSLEGGGETISRETFVRTYVELRLEGLQSRRMEITLEKQQEVLARMGVTEEEMLAFVEYWGDDGDVMMGIWEEADSIIMETRMASGLELEGEAEERARQLREEEDRGRAGPGGGTEGGGP